MITTNNVIFLDDQFLSQKKLFSHKIETSLSNSPKFQIINEQETKTVHYPIRKTCVSYTQEGYMGILDDRHCKVRTTLPKYTYYVNITSRHRQFQCLLYNCHFSI